MSSDIDVLKLELQPFVKRSVTTGAGLPGGTTLVDTALTEPNDFWNGMAILIRTAGPTVDCSGQLRRVLDYDLPTHTLTVNVAFSGQIEAGVQYVMFFPTIFQVNVAPGGGLKADLRQVLGQMADLSPANPLLNDPVNKWARQLGQVDLARVLGAALAANNPVIVGLYDATGNRMPSMDAVARAGYVEVIDRAGRLVGVVYGNQAQLQQVAGTLELITQDTGLHTNPERWLHDNHWDSGVQLVLAAAAAVNLGAAVGAGVTRRIRSITVRNTALVNTVITVSQVAPAQNRLSFDVPAQTTRTWSEQDAVKFLAGVQVQISSSAAAAGAEAYIHASGVEA